MGSVRLAALAFLVALAAATPALARGGGGCLVEGTLIRTPGGEVPIERLRPGDLVLSAAGEPRPILDVVEVEAAECFEVAEGLRATAEHPFLVGPGTYRIAADLGRRIAGPVRARNLVVAPPCTFVAAGHPTHNKGCFVPETEVLTADGRSVPIRDVRPGDRVRAFTLAGALVAAEVERVFTLEVEGFYEVTTERGIAVRATAEHPFYVGEGRFRTVESLVPGDAVVVFRDGLVADRVRSIRRVAGRVRVYNLETDAPNTFVAGGVAVHNKGGGCFAAGTAVATPAGPRPIEALAPGDVVLSGRGAPVAVRIAAIARDEVVEVETEGAILETTREHPLLLSRGSFREVAGLTRLSFLRSLDGGVARVRSVRPTGRTALVYEIEVDEPHTYVAGGFVVHNKGGGGFHSSGGGGRGFSGGSGRRTTYRSGGGSTATGTASTDDDATVRMLIGFVVIGGVVIAVLVGLRAEDKTEEDLDFSFSPDEIEKKAAKTRKLVQRIAENDVDFTPEKLVATARTAFVTLQSAWGNRDYKAMAPLVFSDLRREHEQQIASMIANHEIDLIADLVVEKVEVVHLRYTERKEDRQFTALIQASARDHYVDDRTRRFLRGDRIPARFQELWTFQLKGGRFLLREIEQTRESTALADENFVEFLTDQQLHDTYGEAIAAKQGAAGPWVERPQLEKGTKIHRLLNFLVETDPIWNEKAMKDTARSAAIALYRALEAGQAAGLADLALPEAVEAVNAEVRARSGRRVEYRNLCVRKVELVLVRNLADDARDGFTARVACHAQRITATLSDEDVTPFESYLVFRRAGDRFKLAEVLPPAQGEAAVGEENVDEDSTPDQLQWYYTKERTVT